MKNKALAIVIPAYKQTFLRETLVSIANQTCKDFTLYIGDDCSPYQIKSIVDEFMADIDIVYQRFDENVGGKDLVSHWERCIEMTHNEPYIWLFSDDDIMEPMCVEEFLNLPKSVRDTFLVHFDVSVIDSINGNTLAQQRPYPERLHVKDFIEEKLKIKGKKGLEVFVVEFIFSRKVYLQNEKFQHYDLAWGADFLTWVKFATTGNGIYTVKRNNCHVKWRKSNENITPDESRPILVRKMKSLVYNASYINDWMNSNGYHSSFIYTKFVWGNIKGNSRRLSLHEILYLKKLYEKEVGYHFFSFLSFCAVLIKKSLYL